MSSRYNASMSSHQSTFLEHHAHLIVGSRTDADTLVRAIEIERKAPREGDPDFHVLAFDTLAVDDARELRTLALTRPVGLSGHALFVVSLNEATIEAQNALLKLLEEPPEYAYFYLVVPRAHMLLPTVRSRMTVSRIAALDSVSAQGSESADITDEAGKFLKLSPAKRLDVVKKLVEDISKDKKTKQDAILFLDAVERVLMAAKGPAQASASLEAVGLARSYLGDRAPSIKMLLEHVAVLLP